MLSISKVIKINNNNKKRKVKEKNNKIALRRRRASAGNFVFTSDINKPLKPFLDVKSALDRENESEKGHTNRQTNMRTVYRY